MRYTIGQLQDIARQAGWPENLIVTIAAIGMGESSGDPDARNPNLARENSIGLWQVNRYAWPQYSEADLHDPIYNAQVALAIYQKQGFRAWGAYSNGSYRNFLAASQAAYQGGASSLFGGPFDVAALAGQVDALTSGSGGSWILIVAVAVVGVLLVDSLTG